MKKLLTSMLFLASISLFAQSKSKAQTQKKGGCTASFHDRSVNAILQNNSSQPQIQVTWNNNINVSGSSCFCTIILQRLERQEGNNSYDTLINWFNDTSYIDSSILTGNNYNYRLWRRVACAELNFYSYYSDTVLVQTVGIDEEPIAISKIYPIPASSTLFLETNQLALGEPYRVINITGNEVLSGIISSSKMELNIEALPKGFYFIRINESVKKFVVN